MRIIRFIYQESTKWGVLENGDKIRGLKANPFSSSFELSDEYLQLADVQLLSPVAPGKIVLVGLNYRRHAEELGLQVLPEPIIFLKPPTSIITHKQNIVYPSGINRLDYEAELALIVKKQAKRISVKEADDYILGYTCLNDVTARCIQRKEGQWTRAKSYDTFCPVGPWIETDIDPQDLKIESYLNGQLKQTSRTSDFIFSAQQLIAFISNVMTLNPGDIISTGTPEGVGPMQPGDTVEIKIQGIGILKNKVVTR